jgi:hypothetical protein
MLESFDKKLGEISLARFMLLLFAVHLLFAAVAYLASSAFSSN